MANATKDRNTVKKASAVYTAQEVCSAKATTIYYAGTLVAVDSTGVGLPASLANATLRAAGWVKRYVDNSLGADGDKKVELETGEAKFDKDGGTPPTNADIGKMVFASDNHTISRSAAAGSPAGILTEVETDGVMVGVGPQYSSGPNAAA
jgi:hypothetical protein